MKYKSLTIIFLFCLSIFIYPNIIFANNKDVSKCPAIIKAIDNNDLTNLNKILNSVTSPDVKCLAKSSVFKTNLNLTPLIYAVENNNEAAVSLLLRHKASLEETIVVSNKEHNIDLVFDSEILKISQLDYTPLLASIFRNNTKLSEFLLKKGAFPNDASRLILATDINQEYYFTPLDWAKYLKNNQLIVILVKYGAEFKNTGLDLKYLNYTPLAYLIYNNASLSEVESLLKLGAKVNQFSRISIYEPLHTPLMMAFKKSDLNMVKLLLKYGATLKDLPFDNDLQKLYFWAAQNPDPSMLLFLKENNVKLSYDGYFWPTPLYEAVFNKNPEILSILLSLGYNPNDTHISGITPLHLASKYNEDPIYAKMLISAGADINARRQFAGEGYLFIQNEMEITPLMDAIAYNTRPFEITKLLIIHGADNSLETSNGNKAIDIFKNRTKYGLEKSFVSDKEEIQKLLTSNSFFDKLKPYLELIIIFVLFMVVIISWVNKFFSKTKVAELKTPVVAVLIVRDIVIGYLLYLAAIFFVSAILYFVRFGKFNLDFILNALRQLSIFKYPFYKHIYQMDFYKTCLFMLRGYFGVFCTYIVIKSLYFFNPNNFRVNSNSILKRDTFKDKNRIILLASFAISSILFSTYIFYQNYKLNMKFALEHSIGIIFIFSGIYNIFALFALKIKILRKRKKVLRIFTFILIILNLWSVVFILSLYLQKIISSL